MNSITVYPVKSLTGEIVIPGDKSISHRAIIFASLAEGVTRIRNLLESEDVLCTIDCFREMGVEIQKENQEWTVTGVGMNGLKEPSKTLYCGNSGTTFRLLMGVLAGQNFKSILTGDASLNRRPMKRVIEPLSQMGAEFSIEADQTDHRKIHIEGKPLHGIVYRSPVASAQVKAAILLAGLFAKGETTVIEPTLSRDHTEKMFESCQIPFSRNENSVSVHSIDKILVPPILKVPGDFSSAAFFLVAGALVPNSKIVLKSVGLNPTRTGAFDILKKMGAQISILNAQVEMGEETGDLEISTSSLKSTDIKGDIIPRLIDEVPILSIAAARAKGKATIQDAKELRVKESDRIQGISHLLQKLGVVHQTMQDGLVIEGADVFQSCQINSSKDHRLAMSAAMAALVANGPIQIQDIDCIATSFPVFWDLLKGLAVRCE